MNTYDMRAYSKESVLCWVGEIKNVALSWPMKFSVKFYFWKKKVFYTSKYILVFSIVIYTKYYSML